jgi:hypothetical protein
MLLEVDQTGRHELNMNVSFDVKFTKGLTLENRVEHSTIIHLEIIKEMLSMADLLHRMVLF